MPINHSLFTSHLPLKARKHRIVLLFMVKLLLLMISSHAATAPIPDRYLIENLDHTGYFGRMDKLLYATNATDTSIATDMLLKRIFDLMDTKAAIKTYNDFELLKHDISENIIDAAFVNIFEFFEMEHLVNSDYIYALTQRPEAFEKTLLITRIKSRISTLEDLQGLSITIPSGHFLGKQYLDLELMKRGLPKSKDYFVRINEVNDANTAIIDLFFGKTDCALVTDVAFELTSELNNQIPQDLEILLASTDMIPQVLVLNKNISTHLVRQLDDLIVNVHKTPHIRNLLSLFRVNKITRVKKSQIESSRKLLFELQAMDKRPKLFSGE